MIPYGIWWNLWPQLSQKLDNDISWNFHSGCNSQRSFDFGLPTWELPDYVPLIYSPFFSMFLSQSKNVMKYKQIYQSYLKYYFCTQNVGNSTYRTPTWADTFFRSCRCPVQTGLTVFPYPPFFAKTYLLYTSVPNFRRLWSKWKKKSGKYYQKDFLKWICWLYVILIIKWNWGYIFYPPSHPN